MEKNKLPLIGLTLIIVSIIITGRSVRNLLGGCSFSIEASGMSS